MTTQSSSQQAFPLYLFISLGRPGIVIVFFYFAGPARNSHCIFLFRWAGQMPLYFISAAAVVFYLAAQCSEGIPLWIRRAVVSLYHFCRWAGQAFPLYFFISLGRPGIPIVYFLFRWAGQELPLCFFIWAREMKKYNGEK